MQQPRGTEVSRTADTPQEGPEIELFTEPCQLQGSARHQESLRRDNPAHSQRRQGLFPVVAQRLSQKFVPFIPILDALFEVWLRRLDTLRS